MGKKRTRGEPANAPSKQSSNDIMQDGSSDEEHSAQDFDVVQVDFEWFNFDASIDFHGVKSLLRQLFDVDATLFDLSALTDLVLSRPTIGSAVKVDGKETDAYAFTTIINVFEHRANAAVKTLVGYLAEKALTNQDIKVAAEVLQGDYQVGLILTERLINVPSEVISPMYTMLVDEIEAAVEDKEPYNFSHYLVLSRTFQMVESSLDREEGKRKKFKGDSIVKYFHPEDEIWHKKALAFGDFRYNKEGEMVSDSKRAFQDLGIKTSGHMTLIEGKDKFEAAAKEIHYMAPAPS